MSGKEKEKLTLLEKIRTAEKEASDAWDKFNFFEFTSLSFSRNADILEVQKGSRIAIDTRKKALAAKEEALAARLAYYIACDALDEATAAYGAVV